ncbi:hypothetical protein ZIOFF_042602 [Zingiber officinale]|nr:hypothetical protein ZIOFF_042602 [Zingiber officinale]
MILLALCRAKTFSLPAASAVLPRNSAPPWCPPRSCISSADDRKKNKKNKRVQFASEVVEFYVSSRNDASAASEEVEEEVEDRRPPPRMPANRVALYKGLLRDRETQRVACCY